MLVALFAPPIAGTKPIVCKYKGHIYFPCLGYFNRGWENPIFRNDRFRDIYSDKLEEEGSRELGDLAARLSGSLSPRARRRMARPARQSRRAPKATRAATTGSAPISKASTSSPKWSTARRSRCSVGFVSMGIAAAIGITLGALAGYFGGWVDMLHQPPDRSRDVHPDAGADPRAGRHARKVTNLAPDGHHRHHQLDRHRPAHPRPSSSSSSEMEFVTAARAMGAGRLRIMFRHMLPQRAGPGAGADHLRHRRRDPDRKRPQLPRLRRLAAEPQLGHAAPLRPHAIQQMWWLILFPGLAIFLTVLAYNLIGEGLQEATDPRLRQAAH